MHKKVISVLHSSGPLWNMLGSLMFGLNTFVLLMLVSRQAGVEATGVFGLPFTTAQLLSIVGVFGASDHQMTDFQQDFSFATYGRVKVFSCILMAISAALVCLALSSDAGKTVLLAVLSVYMAAHAISELYQSRMFQMNRLDLAGQSQFFRTLFSLVCFAIALWVTQNLVASTIVLAVANVASIWLFSYLPCRPFMGTRHIPAPGDTKRLILTCLPLFLSLLLMNLVIQLPKYVIEMLGTNEMQGIFNIIFIPAQIINMISGFIYRPLLHRFSTLLGRMELKDLFKLLKSQILLVLGFTVFVALGAWFLGTSLLGAFYGVDLHGQQLAVTLVVVGGGIFAIDALLYYIAVILRKQGFILLNYVVALALGAVFCFFFVGMWGILGAVLTFVLIHVLLLIGYTVLIFAAIKEKAYV